MYLSLAACMGNPGKSDSTATPDSNNQMTQMKQFILSGQQTSVPRESRMRHIATCLFNQPSAEIAELCAMSYDVKKVYAEAIESKWKQPSDKQSSHMRLSHRCYSFSHDCHAEHGVDLLLVLPCLQDLMQQHCPGKPIGH